MLPGVIPISVETCDAPRCTKETLNVQKHQPGSPTSQTSSIVDTDPGDDFSGNESFLIAVAKGMMSTLRGRLEV